MGEDSDKIERSIKRSRRLRLAWSRQS